MQLQAIGIIHSPYKTRGEAPRQGRLSSTESVIELYEEYDEALIGIADARRLVALYWGDRADRSVLSSPTPFSAEPRGVFTSRSPNRPNPVALCVVDLVAVDGRRLTVRGLDALDGSPVVDLKAYIEERDGTIMPEPNPAADSSRRSGTPTTTVSLAVFGCGTVGGALLDLIAARAAPLAADGLEPRVVAIANSRRMVVDPAGIDLASWREALSAASAPTDPAAVMALGPSVPGPVLVDCTAGDDTPRAYPAFFAAGFDVVTANKRGNSGPLEQYRGLAREARRRGRLYLYEANVGAGLPVVDNLRRLFMAGDSLIEFSGVLSGSLSFLFGRLEDGQPFSAAVREAMERGFTEPDPRDDLSGADVARKVLLLAREAGMALEPEDVERAGLVPPEYLAISKDEFVARLPELDDGVAALASSAASRGAVLRYAGSIAGGRVSAGVVEAGPDHPLRSVRGGENALAFHTRYYDPVPLVVRGYGAGALVTAAGVFGDVLRAAGR